jgi:uncharacterized protein
MVIFFVQNQEEARDFYAQVFDEAPLLDVPGMTEFNLPDGSLFGLMPLSGMRNLLGEAMKPYPVATGAPRAELYIQSSTVRSYFSRALSAGARELSPFLARPWGDVTAYCMDPFGHLLAFAEEEPNPAEIPEGRNS